jgi:DNA processing protein
MAGRDEVAGWVALRAAAGVGDATGRRLLARFGGPWAVLTARADELAAAGFGRPLAESLAAARDAAAALREAERIRAADARLVACSHAEYPALLAQVPDAPLYLIARGQALVGAPAVAVVGARRATPYGRDVAERLAAELAQAGVTVVSGLARGIDGAAHRGALRAGGQTLAVLGSGVNVVYPPEHRDLAAEIVRSGTLLSERPVGAPPLAASFPARNRIIAGMTHGTLVVEAGERSGALITAHLALDYDREVFAVPGRIDSPASVGTHRLIQQGARLVSAVDDVLSEIAPALAARATGPGSAPTRGGAVDPRAQALLTLLAGGPVGIDRLVQESGFPASEVLARVLELEIQGLVAQHPGHQVHLVRR